MPLLSETDRSSLSADLMRTASTARIAVPLTKAQLRAAIDAADNWIDGNAAAFNAALPPAARTGLTPRQKAELFFFVARQRHEAT